MNIKIDIEGIVTNAVSKALSYDNVSVLVERMVDYTVKEAIEQSLRRHSEFGRAVSKHVEQVVKFDATLLSEHEGPKFTHAIGQIIRAKVAALNNDAMKRAIEPMLDEILKPMPQVMKLSDLVKIAVDDWSDDCGEPREGRPTVIVERKEGILSDYFQIYLDKEHKSRSSGCGYALRCNQVGEVYSMRIYGTEIKNSLFAGPFYHFDALLFQLYTNKVRIEVDTTDFSDVYYHGQEDD